MRCGRCLRETAVERHEVDGFGGYLCERCLAEWNRLTDCEHGRR